MNKDDKARVQKYLQEYSTLTLATSQDDKPWAATVFFVSDSDLNLYFVSDYRTHHGVDMAQNSRVAATINPDCDNWHDVHGVQVSGTASVVDGLQRAKALMLYLKKFPQIDQLYAKPSGEHEETIAKRLKAANFYCIKPDWIRFIDNAKGFGHREEFRL